MSQYSRRRWTRSEIGLMLELRAADVPWKRVAELCGHPRYGCQSKLQDIDANPEKFMDLPQRLSAIVQAKSDRIIVPVMPHSRLLFDQEIRERIAERGLTGGMFGDPPPGRSMLDKKLAGAAP